MISTRIMYLCKSCTIAEPNGRQLFCGLTGKSCAVHPRDVNEDCVNYGKPELDKETEK
jgi:hypothetical protein